MRERLATLEAILPTLATKADVAEVRSDIRGWMLATVLAIIGTMLAAIFGVSQIVKAPVVAAPQPTIVVVPASAIAAPATPR